MRLTWAITPSELDGYSGELASHQGELSPELESYLDAIASELESCLGYPVLDIELGA